MKRSAPVSAALAVALLAAFGPIASAVAEEGLRAGAAAVDISPQTLPVIVSGSFLEHTAAVVRDPLHARCLVLDDATTRAAVVVVDSLMMPRDLLDRAKELSHAETGISTDHIMIAATHTHSAPSAMAILGSGLDETYAAYLPGKIAESIARAAENLSPARVGWTAVRDDAHTHCRRWVLRPDRIGTDPFGSRTVRAMMHPGYQNPAYVGPAGPADPWLSILAVQSPDGRPIAMVANYSMHYFGSAAVSADYYGRFVRELTALLGAEAADPPVVAMMSQGTSGDLHWMDYSEPRKSIGIDQYAREVAEKAAEAYRTIQYHDAVPVVMAETTLTLGRRVADEERLAWAREMAEKMGNRVPKDRPEVYALEQIFLHDDPVRELKLQALRVGELGITAIPCEVYGITGLKVKAQSPLELTFNLELANGAEGYIPPPEQHHLGGYTTWPARSAGLEVQAEPKIVDAVLGLLETVADRPRRAPLEPAGPYVEAVLASQPMAYYRLDELQGPHAKDAADGHVAFYEPGVAFYLPGPQSPGFAGEGGINRAAHFAGGRIAAGLGSLEATYSVELWLWNGMPSDARPVTGYFLSRGPDGDPDAAGDHLGIGGTHVEEARGKLIFYNGDTLEELLVGKTEVPFKQWCHVVLVREGRNVRVYLNGRPEPDIDGQAAVGHEPGVTELLFGGRNDNFANFEGKLDEIAVYNRALTPEEIAGHYRAAGPASD